MKEELKSILDELREVLKDSNLVVSNECVLDCALRLYNTEQINKSRDYPKQFNSFQKSQGREPFTKKLNNEVPKSNEEPMTDSQIKYFKKNNLTITKDMTKKEAWKIIKEHKG